MIAQMVVCWIIRIYKKHYKMVAKAIQHVNFTRNLNCTVYTAIFFIIGEVKEIIFVFSQGTMKVLWFSFTLI